MPGSRLLSIEQAAQRVGLRHAALRRAVQRGELPATKLCGRIRIDPGELEAWISRHRVETPGAASLAQ